MKDSCFLWEHILFPVSFPNLLPPKFWAPNRLNSPPHCRASGPGVKERVSLSAGGQEGTEIISRAEACFFGFSGASGRNNFKYSCVSPLFTNRRLNTQGWRGPIGGRLPETACPSTGLLRERTCLPSFSSCRFLQRASGILALWGSLWEIFHQLETGDTFPGH